jgi:hypothetical protein
MGLSSGRPVWRIRGGAVHNLDARLTRAELPKLARILGITPDCVRMWRHRGLLAPGDDGCYRLGDVLALNGQMRRHPNSRRAARAA